MINKNFDPKHSTHFMYIKFRENKQLLFWFTNNDTTYYFNLPQTVIAQN